MDKYDGEYFAFGVNSPHAVMVYGQEILGDSCVLFQKRKNNLVPVGEPSIMWERTDTDRPPVREQAIEFLRGKNITKIFTADVPIEGLWGLVSAYAPKDWDYDEDPYPPAEVYFSISFDSGFLDEEKIIRVVKAEDAR